METCPRNNCDGNIVERMNSRTSEIFYGCSKFPVCRFSETRHGPPNDDCDDPLDSDFYGGPAAGDTWGGDFETGDQGQW